MKRFQKKVLNLVKQIPKGKVTTYKVLARALGKPKVWRAVGNALNKNPKLIKIPCHRVVRSNGQVGGFRLGQRKKIKLLRKEGIEIHKNKAANLDKHLYKW